MKEYFKLQLKMFERKLSDFGINPLLGIFFLILLFIFGSYYLFEKSELVAPIYAGMALVYVLKNNKPDRNIFLKSIFKQTDFYIIRIIENLVVSIPFMVFLVLYEHLILAILLLFFSIIMALFRVMHKVDFVIPTPFYKNPFEFIVGFRKTILIVLLSWFLSIMAIVHENFNLGIFSILMLYVLSITYYANPEKPYYILNFNRSPRNFLFTKIQTAFFQCALLIAPNILALAVVYRKEWSLMLLFFAFGHIFLMAAILAKYASYPNQMHPPYQLMLILSAIFPPLLLMIIPFFYWKSLQKLNEYLA
jgi:hypothetical protein